MQLRDKIKKIRQKSEKIKWQEKDKQAPQ
jgi:hypothetical protein